MKNWPNPHNPEGLPPAAPGYRYLGKDEPYDLERDETGLTLGSENWCLLKHMPASGISHFRHRWTIRRALNVDDHFAPPPEEWTRPGWEVMPSSDGYRLAKGEEVWSCGSSRWVDTNEGLTHDKLYIRRPIQPSMATSPILTGAANLSTGRTIMSTKVELKPGQTIVVNVHASKVLSQAVQEAAFEAGYGWWNDGKLTFTPEWQHIKSYPDGAHISIPVGRKTLYERRLMFSPESYYCDEHADALFLDARTDLGLLIDLLAKPPAPVPPTINGYTAEYAKDGNAIKFGCANISLDLLNRAREVIERSYLGNRGVQSVTLDSGVVLKIGDIKAALDYVKAVNESIS